MFLLCLFILFLFWAAPFYLILFHVHCLGLGKLCSAIFYLHAPVTSCGSHGEPSHALSQPEAALHQIRRGVLIPLETADSRSVRVQVPKQNKTPPTLLVQVICILALGVDLRLFCVSVAFVLLVLGPRPHL